LVFNESKVWDDMPHFATVQARQVVSPGRMGFPLPLGVVASGSFKVVRTSKQGE